MDYIQRCSVLFRAPISRAAVAVGYEDTGTKNNVFPDRGYAP